MSQVQAQTQLDPLQKLEKDRKFVQDNEWMIRPCTLYHGEYKNCKSIKGRFYQYYSDGKIHDCNEWLTNEQDCKRYKKRDDYSSGSRVIKSEMRRMEARIQAHKDNDVWKQREERPPPNWLPPLSPHLEAYQKQSYFLGKEDEMRHGYNMDKWKCVVM